MAPTLTPEELKPTTELSKGKELEPTTMEIVPLSPEMRTAMDEQMQEEVDGTFGSELTKFETSQQEYDTKSETAKTEGLAKISTEEEKVKQEQLLAQEKGQDDIASHKDTWKEENEKIKEEYENKAGSKRQETEDQIDAKVKEGELNIEKTSKEATEEAERKKREAQAKAESEKKKPKGFWDKVGDAVSAALDVLMEAVNFIFDNLKAAVKVIIETAKQAVNVIIDTVRNLAIGFIKAFGEALKVFVSIAFAAFPGVAKWVNEKIDQAVEFAVTMVNELADGLKAFANMILDEIGGFIDAYLSLLQDVYIGIFTVLKAFSDLNDLLKRLGYLKEGFLLGGQYFPGAIAEEMLGTNIAEPIYIERSPEEQAEFMNPPAAAMAPEKPATPSANQQDQQLMNKTELTEEDVVLEGTPQEMDQEFMDSLPPMEDGEQIPLGGADDPVTRADLNANAFGSPVQETVATPQEQETAPADNAAPKADITSMNDEQKMDFYIDEMGKEGEETPDASKPVDKGAPPKGIDAAAKTGPLSPLQRTTFAMRQMWKGLETWWNKNQTAIILSMVGILIVAGVVAFFTAGTGLVPLAMTLMEVLTVYFIADAIKRIQGYIREFFQLSWNGDPKKGGKALATGLAVLINEFLFEVMLKGVGKLMTKLKNLVKSTRTFRKSAIAMKRTSKAVKNMPGIKQIRQASTKGGKFVVGGFNKLTTKGAKGLKEIKERVLKFFGFKRTWIEKHGDYFELWGEFNPKVRLMKGKMKESLDPSDPNYKVKNEIIDNPYPNQLSKELNDELADAAKLKVKPISPSNSVEFDKIISDGEIKWAITEEGELLVMPKMKNGIELKHPVLTKGNPVLSAGEASIAGNAKDGYYILDFNTNSGHFKPSNNSIIFGKEAFSKNIKILNNF